MGRKFGRKRQFKMQPVGLEHLTQYNQLLRYVFQVTDQELKEIGWEEKDMMRAKSPTLERADVLMLEANHDIRMLQAGPYPYMLKQRILSDRGHLSNDASSALLNRVLHDKLQTIMLGHLSECNNLPELAYETVRLGIEMEENPYHGNDFRLMVADRRLPSPVVEITK